MVGFFFLSILFVKIVLNERFLVAGKVPMTELYAEFWDMPILGCVPIVFEKLLSLGCWPRLSFCQDIVDLIPVLCFPVE